MYNALTLNNKEHTMRKVTALHFVKIQRLMLKTTEDYINTFVTNEDDSSSLSMYADDVAYNINALVAFNKNKDAQALHNSIMRQDTLVREYFINALRYLEDEDLVHERCCS